MVTIRTHLLDTSALIKLVVAEEGSEIINRYQSIGSVFWTTSICFAEALGVLKTKHFYRNEISRKKYLASAYDLVARLRNRDITIQEVKLTDFGIFNEVENIAEKYRLDIADAFQLVTLKLGFPSNLEGESKTILITADNDLANAARQEGLRVWNILEQEEPDVNF